jgi:hypothetical protein
MSINEAESTIFVGFLALPLSFSFPFSIPSPAPANDSSEMESASMELGDTGCPWMVSMVSTDRMLGRDAQLGRESWCPDRERGASLMALAGRRGAVTDKGEGVSPNNCVNFRHFLTRSARSCGWRWFVVGGRSSNQSAKPGLSRGVVSTAVTGAEMEGLRAWDGSTYAERRKSGLGVVGKGGFARGG